MAIQAVFSGGGTYGYAVRWVSSSADGAGNGTTSVIGTAIGAWTLTQAMTSAVAGQVVRIMDDGTYTLAASVDPVADGSTSGFVAFVGFANQNGADSNGGRPIISCGSAARTLGSSNDDLVLWEHLQIQGSTDTAMAAGSYCMLYDLVITGNSGNYGVALGGSGAWVIGCHIYANTCSIALGANGNGSQIWWSRIDGNVNGLRTTGALNTVAFCEITDNSGYGVQGLISRSSFIGNTIEGNGGDGLDVPDGNPSLVMLNLMTNNGGFGLDPAFPLTLLDLSNHYHGNTAGEVDGAPIQVGKTSGDPLYAAVASDDYRLKLGSPAARLQLGVPFLAGTWLDKGAQQSQPPAVVTGKTGGR